MVAGIRKGVETMRIIFGVLVVVILAMTLASCALLAPTPAPEEELPSYIQRWAAVAATADFKAVLIAVLLLLLLLLLFLLYFLSKWK